MLCSNLGIFTFIKMTFLTELGLTSLILKAGLQNIAVKTELEKKAGN